MEKIQKFSKLFILICLLIGTVIYAPTLSPVDKIDIPVCLYPVITEPSVLVTVDRTRYKCLFDLGCNVPLILNKKAIEDAFFKRELGVAQIRDFKGNVYPCSKFEFPELHLGDLYCTNIEVLQEDDAFYFNTRIGNEKKSDNDCSNAQLDGKMGRGLIENFYCLIDFPNCRISLSKEDFLKNKLEKNFIKIPMQIENFGIVVTTLTDLGEARFILDTGSSYSSINRSYVKTDCIKELERGSNDWYFPSNLRIGTSDYGFWEFALFELDKMYKADGCLGADFFLENAIYFDFKEGFAYIKKPERSFILTQWKRLKRSFWVCSQKYIGMLKNFNGVKLGKSCYSFPGFLLNSSTSPVFRNTKETPHFCNSGEESSEITFEISWEFSRKESFCFS